MNHYIKKISAFVKNPENTNFIYTCLALFITGVFALAIFYFSSLPSDSDDDKNITKEEKDLILSEIIKNNPKDLYSDLKNDDEKSTDVTIKKNDPAPVVPKVIEVKTPTGQKEQVNSVVDPVSPTTNAPIPIPTTNVDGVVSGLDPVDVIAPNLDEYNYQKNIISFEKGEEYRSCLKPYYFEMNNHIDFESIADYESVYYSYFDKNHSFYKYESSFDNAIESAYLGKYGNDINESYSYQGGEFVAKSLYDIDNNFSNVYTPTYVSYPVSSPESYVDGSTPIPNVSSYFGDNAVISKQYKENGKLYYDIETEYEYYCADDDTSSTLDIVSVLKVDADTFTIINTSLYLDEVKNSNLIYKSINESSRDSITRDEADDIFSNDYTDEEVVVNYRDYDYSSTARKAQIKEYLLESDLEIVIPEDADIYFTGVYGREFPAAVENSDYYLDRDYYASNDLGQSRYDKVMDFYNAQPLLSLYGEVREIINNTYPVVTLQTFENTDEKYDEFMENYESIEDEFYTLDEGVINFTNIDAVETLRLSKTSSNYYMYNYPSYSLSYPVVRDYYADPESFPESYNYTIAVPFGTEDMFRLSDSIFKVIFWTNDLTKVNQYHYLFDNSESTIDGILNRSVYYMGSYY